MWYLLVGEDVENSLELRKRLRAAHLERLRALADADRLLLAGPLPAVDAEDPGAAGFSGSAVVAAFGSLDEARAWAEQDPYVTGGVYRHVSVRPFLKVLP